ncbi:MAG: hypothetical protein ACOCT0_05895 [Halobacteriota archaeon]
MTDDEADDVERLRDVFVETTGVEEVRETKRSRGRLRSETEIEDDLRDVVQEVADEHGLPDWSSVEDGVETAVGYFEGLDDAEIAAGLDRAEDDVRSLRHHLCLVRDDEQSEIADERDRDAGYSVRLRSAYPEEAIDERLTESAKKTGLEEATEDSEVETEM